MENVFEFSSSIESKTFSSTGIFVSAIVVAVVLLVKLRFEETVKKTHYDGYFEYIIVRTTTVSP